MPPVQIDGLWHCLCPSYGRSFSKPLRRPLLKLNGVKQRCRYAQEAQSVDFVPNPYLRSGTFRPGLKYQPALPQKKEKRPRLSRARAIPELSTEDAYEELRQAARQGDYVRVKEYVKLLVGERNEKPSAQLYHAMILANAHPRHGSPSEVVSLLLEMVQHDIHPDSTVYHAVLRVLSVHPDYLLRKEIIEQLHQRWFSLTPEGWHDVIAGLIRDRQLETAMVNLQNVEQKGVKIEPWLFDMLSYTLCEMSEFDEALKLMQRRFWSGESRISPTLWYHLLDSASRALHHDAVAFVWRTRVEPGHLQPPDGICINVLNTAARHGDAKLATAVFYALSSRKHTLQPHYYETLLESWLESHNLKAAFTILSVMLETRMPPSEASTRAIYQYLCDDPGRPTKALQILHQLKNEDRPMPHAALNVILEAYIHYNDLGSALEKYKSMHMIIPSGPNTSTFNILFRGCRFAQRKDLAMFLASEMLALNVAPNALTYDRLILVCLNAKGEPDGGFEDAWRYFEEMRQVDWWPRQLTLRELGRAGCEMADQRVWSLVHERGFDEGRMEYLMKWHWGKRVDGWKAPKASEENVQGGADDGVPDKDTDVEKASDPSRPSADLGSLKPLHS